MKKKIVTLLLVAAMTGTMVVGCGSKADDKTADTKTEQTDEIIEMDWLLDNVVGRVPEYEELDDNSKMLVINQGIIDVND